MAYVDEFLIAVPTANREAFRDLAASVAPVFRDHGALAVMECWGDDVPEGELTSMAKAVKLEPGETVVFSWVLWPSREARDAGNEKIMSDPRMQGDETPPFDSKRMIFGGFEVLLDA